jgi:WXXGXW repeat (2 copies)
MHWRLLSVALAAAALGACATRTVTTREVIREQPVVQTAPAPAAQPSTVMVLQPPPAPQESMPAAPAVGYSWVAGHYEFRNGSWAWRPGQWVAGTIRPLPAPLDESRPPPVGESSRWIPGHWTFIGNDWVWVKGRWM